MMGGEVVVFWEGGVSLPLSPRPDFEKKGENWKEDQLPWVWSPNNRRHFLILWWKGCEKRVSDVAIEITTQCYVLVATTLKSHLKVDHICLVIIAVGGGAQSTSCGLRGGARAVRISWHSGIEIKTTTHWTLPCHHCNTYSKNFGLGWIK